MKKFFTLKLFLLCNYVCVAYQYDYKPKFKAVIHSNRYFFSGCPIISRPVSIAPLISYQVTSRPKPSLLDYKFIFSTLRSFYDKLQQKAPYEALEVVTVTCKPRLQKISGLVYTYKNKDVEFKVNLENEINAAFGGEQQAKQLGFNFKNAKVCVNKNDNNCLAVHYKFANSWNNIVALLAVNQKNQRAILKNLHYFCSTKCKQFINMVVGDSKSGIVYYMGSSPEHVECISDHSITLCKFLIKCIVDSQKLHKKPELWDVGLANFLSTHSSTSSHKQISDKDQFEKSCSDCEKCNKKIDWLKSYINSKNSCINKKRPCSLFSWVDFNIINLIVQSRVLLEKCESIASLRCNDDYVQKLTQISPYSLKKLIPKRTWTDSKSCLKCRKFLGEQVSEIYSKLISEVYGKLGRDFSVIFSLCNKDESYPASPEQIAQNIEDKYLIKWLRDYGGYNNDKAPIFHTFLGYKSHKAFVNASLQDVVQKIKTIIDDSNLKLHNTEFKFLHEMHIMMQNNLVLKRFLDAYLNYKAGDTSAFDKLKLTEDQSKVMKEHFDNIEAIKNHLGNIEAMKNHINYQEQEFYNNKS